MKKKLWFILAGVFIITGCNQQEFATEEGLKVIKKQEEKTEQVEKDKVEKNEVLPAEESEKKSQDKTETEPAYRLAENWSLKPINSETKEEVVLLTIDDAPDQYALQMAETLVSIDAPAIFFVNGHFLDTEEEKQVLKKIHRMGFEIGNHTYSHRSLPEIDQAEQRKEVEALNDLIEEITGERPKFFRAPHGLNTDFSKQLMKEEKMLLMNWSYGYDWDKKYSTKEAIADIMVNSELLVNGSNLLMHDRKWTAAGLEDIVKGLRAKGYEILDPDLIEIPSE